MKRRPIPGTLGSQSLNTPIMSFSRSALPPFYFVIFGIYEPLLTGMGFIGALMDPIKARNSSPFSNP